MIRKIHHLFQRTVTPGSFGGQSIRLEIICGKNLKVPSFRIPAGIFVSINVDLTRCWTSAIRVLSSDESLTFGDILTLALHKSSELSVEIRASYELDQMLGQGELIGKLEVSWDKLLNHGAESFVQLSFPSIRGVHPSLTLKVTCVHDCRNEDDALFVPVVECEIVRRTDAGHSRFAKYMITKLVAHLHDAVAHFQSVLDKCPVGHPDRAAALTNLGWTRLEGYTRKDLQDMDTTIPLLRQALALRPGGHPDRALSLYYLTTALIRRKERTAAEIREYIYLYHELLVVCLEDTYLRSIGLDNNGVEDIINQCNNLPKDASEEGIHLRRIVLELCPPGHRHHPRELDHLSRALYTRFTHNGCMDDIDESIQLGRKAVSLCPVGHPERDSYLNHLAISLRFRLNHQGEPRDLDEAISLCEEALRLCPVGHERRHAPLDTLGGALRTRFKQRGDINDIDKAISHRREALRLRPLGHPRRDTAHQNLALALQARYDNSHASENVNEAIDLYRESLRLKPLKHPERHRTLYGLSLALCSRFRETQKNEDVEEAILLCKESLAALPPLHPDRCISYARLQQAYLFRYQMQHNPVDLSLAVENFRLASTHATQGFPNRITEAIRWTATAEDYNHVSAVEAYTTCFKLLDGHLTTRSSTISRREAAIAFRRARTLPVDAASCAIRHDNLRQAIELGEQGRGQQWSLASRLRTPLEDLESVNPNLAHKFLELSNRLSIAGQGSAVSTDKVAAELAAREHRRVTTQWETALEEIRNFRGFSGFLLPPLYEDLRAAACHGPVIILIASKYSCNAVIITKSGEPRHVCFSSFTLAELEKLKDDFAKAIRSSAFLGPTEPRTELRTLLRMVWEHIMLPIVHVLQRDLKVRGRSRIWLCPTAAFTSIPLHAAHPFRPKVDGSGQELCLEDIYICSYTPTLLALIRARQMMKKSVTQSFVAIGQGQPGAEQGTVLAAVDSELDLLRELVPPNVNITHLSGENATQAAALEALRQNTWVHLACHGKQDREQPYNSSFAMRDKPLTLLDIMDNNAPQAEFAFLSACHTAVGDEQMPDEAIHLAAGLQFSGFKSVIGTLWGVDDAVTHDIVTAFYKRMFKDGVMDCTRAAYALNKAMYDVRRQVPLEQRIVFIHIGV